MPGSGKIKNKDHNVAALSLISTGKGGLFGLAGNSILFCLSYHFYLPSPHTHPKAMPRFGVLHSLKPVGRPSWLLVVCQGDLGPAFLVPSACGSARHNVCGGPGTPAAIPSGQAQGPEVRPAHLRLGQKSPSPISLSSPLLSGCLE